MSKRRSTAKRAAGSTRSAWARDLAACVPSMPELVRLETIVMGEIWGEHYHTSGTHELVHVQQGSARLRLKSKREALDVGPGDTFVIPRGTVHRDETEGEKPYRVILVFFDWPGADSLVKRITPKPLLAASIGVRAHVQRMMKELEVECQSERRDATERVNLALLEVLLELLRHSVDAHPRTPGGLSEAAARRRERLAARVHEHLLEHHSETESLEHLAARFDVSPFHLSRTFSRQFGVSITDMLAMVRMDRAKELLAGGELSVKEVARAVGYSSGNYFAKAFRRVCGVSPSEYQSALPER